MKPTWINIYSDTEEPDKFGRWERRYVFGSRRIASIVLTKNIYSIHFNFPLERSIETVYMDFDSAKIVVEKEWENFVAFISPQTYKK